MPYRFLLLCLLCVSSQSFAQDRDALLQSGYAYLAEGEYELARQQFDLLVSLNHRDVEGRLGMGQAYFYLGDLQRAANNFEIARYRNEEDARGHYWAGRVSYEEHSFSDAYLQLGLAFNRDSLMTGLHHYLGVSAYELGYDSVAFHHLQLATLESVKPDYSWFYLGRVLLEYEYLDEAQNAFENALEIDERIPRFHVGLGDVWYERNVPDQAAFHYQNATRRNPEYGEAWYRLSEALLAADHVTRAHIAFKRAQALIPSTDPGMLWLQARLYTALERYPEAKAILLEHSAKIRRYLEVNLLLAQIYTGLEDHASAAAVYEILVKRYDEVAAVQEGYAGTLYRLGSFENAIEWYQKLEASFPEETRYTFNRAICQAEAGQTAPACEVFEQLSAGGNAEWAEQADSAMRKFCR